MACHRCDVSSELRCPGAKPWGRAPSLATTLWYYSEFNETSSVIPVVKLSCSVEPAVSSVLLAVRSVAKRALSVREVWGSIPGPVKSAQCRQRLAIVATFFFRSCVAQALSRGDRPRNSLHASA